MSQTLTLLCWNVNGLRAVLKKGFLDFLDREAPDILCIQETKAEPAQLGPEVLSHDHYHSYFHSSSVKKGYSGVATFTRQKPLKIETGFGIERFDAEGRCLMTEFEDFVLFNVYFPNGKKDSDRLNFKLEFYEAFLKRADSLKKRGKPVIFCGDVNTAHQPIDLSHPRENEHVSGFLPVERAWIDRVLEHGYLDTLRAFHKEGGLFTWWDLKTRARERNIGWRIDYFFIDDRLRSHLQDSFIMPNVMGSDHCPLGIRMRF